MRKVDEVFMKSSIRRDFSGDRSIVMSKNDRTGGKRALLCAGVVMLLFVFQMATGRVGRYVANMFSYEKIDPYNAYAWNFMCHITMMILGLIAILALRKLLKIDFGFGFGDTEKGIRFIVMYTAIFTGNTLVVHILMKLSNSLPVYAFPLNKRNIVGTLSFQLFLTGPAEELLYRALPITILMLVSGKSTEIRRGVTLETIIAAFLFAIAHMKWSLFPLNIEANFFQLIYAFAQGIISGKAYQETRSVIYPMFMHSFSNVLMVGTGYLFMLL